MNLEQIENMLRGTTAKPIVDGLCFSVLVPLIEINNELNLIFEVRSMSIKRQPGEISFPGGQIEYGESSLDAAVRETYEEIGIEREHIKIITELDYVSHKESAIVYSYLGYNKDESYSDIKFSKDEVDELFYVPLSFFLENEPEKHYVSYYPETKENFPFHMINNGANYKWDEIKYPVYFYKYNNYIIWGLTAKITYDFIKKIKNKK
jgi:8-oxo-dGTP pyrophosphatase MutT (NUDIX family)